jgi:hypothetical protein
MKKPSSGKSKTQIPARYQHFEKSYPAVMQAVEALGEVTQSAGPLDSKTRALVKLAIAVGALRERVPCTVTRVERWRQAAPPTSYGTWECWQSRRLAFLVPWQQCRGLKIFFERSIA